MLLYCSDEFVHFHIICFSTCLYLFTLCDLCMIPGPGAKYINFKYAKEISDWHVVRHLALKLGAQAQSLCRAPKIIKILCLFAKNLIF